MRFVLTIAFAISTATFGAASLASSVAVAQETPAPPVDPAPMPPPRRCHEPPVIS